MFRIKKNSPDLASRHDLLELAAAEDDLVGGVDQQLGAQADRLGSWDEALGPPKV